MRRWLRAGRHAATATAATTAARRRPVVVMVVLVLYWAQLLQAHRDQLAQVEAQTRLRATQMASALSLQIGSLFNGVDYVSRTLANTYRDDQPEVFRQALDLAKKKAFPEGALVQIAVADAHPLGARPFAREQYIQKFRTLAAPVLDEAEINRFLDLVQRLPELTAAELGGLTIVAKPGVLASVINPVGLF